MTDKIVRGQRVMWGLGCVVVGVVAASAFAMPIRVTTAQEAVPSTQPVTGTELDPLWLKLIQTERHSGSPSEFEGIAATGLTLHLLLEDGAVSGYAPSDGPIEIRSHRSGQPDQVTSVTPVFTPDGWFYANSLIPYYIPPYLSLRQGDVVEVVQANHAISVTVPALSVWADSTQDALFGVGSSGTSLTMHFFPALQPEQEVTATTTAGPGDAFHFDLSSLVDVQAADHGFVRQILDPSRSVSARFVAPQIQVEAEGQYVYGYVAPGRVVTVSVLEAGSVLTQVPGLPSTTSGRFGLVLQKNGSSWLMPGRQVRLETVGQTVTMTIPTLTTQVDFQSGVIQGSTSPGQWLSVLQQPGPISASTGDFLVFDPSSSVTATVSGEYSSTLTLEPLDFGAVLARDLEGHFAYRRWVLPGIQVVYGRPFAAGPQISGQSSAMSAPVTISVAGPSGLLKGLFSYYTSEQGAIVSPMWPSDSQQNFGIAGGDVITLETPSGVDTVLHVPALDVAADVPTQHISGHAPAGATLRLHLERVEPWNEWPSGYDTEVVVGPDGTFALDLQDVRLTEMSPGRLAWVGPDGNSIILIFATRQSCLPTVFGITVHGNTVQVDANDSNQAYPCQTTTLVRLKNGNGVIKGETQASYYDLYVSDSLSFWSLQGVPVIILPGDRIEIRNGDQSREWLVPELSVMAQDAADLVTGTAPPLSVVRIAVTDLGASTVTARGALSVTTGANGQFALSVPLDAGTLIAAQVSDSEALSFSAYTTVPGLALKLYGSGVGAALTPLSTYTATVQTTRPPSPTTTSGRADDRGQPEDMYQAGSTPPLIYFSNTIVPGDRVTVQSGVWTRTLDVPAITAQYDQTTQKVVGQTLPQRPVSLRYIWSNEILTTTSNTSGLFEFTLTPSPYQQTSFELSVMTAQGDIVAVDVGAALWSVQLGRNCLSITLPTATEHAVLEQRGASGALKGTAEIRLQGSIQLWWTPCLTSNSVASPVQPGDRLTLLVNGRSWEFVVPLLSAYHDPVRETVTGQAPPNGMVAVHMNGFGTGVPTNRRVPTDGNGRYGVDVSDVDWYPGQPGSVMYRDALGNVIELQFSLTGLQQWLPLIGHP